MTIFSHVTLHGVPEFRVWDYLVLWCFSSSIQMDRYQFVVLYETYTQTHTHTGTHSNLQWKLETGDNEYGRNRSKCIIRFALYSTSFPVAKSTFLLWNAQFRPDPIWMRSWKPFSRLRPNFSNRLQVLPHNNRSESTRAVSGDPAVVLLYFPEKLDTVGDRTLCVLPEWVSYFFLAVSSSAVENWHPEVQPDHNVYSSDAL